MSLINDVLRDLERRRAPERVNLPDDAARQPRTDRPRHRNRRWPLWLLAALALGAILHLSLDGDPALRTSVEPGTLTAQASPEAEPKPGLETETAPARTEQRAAPEPEQSTVQAEVAQSTGGAAPLPSDTLDGDKHDKRESAAAPTRDKGPNEGLNKKPDRAARRTSDRESGQQPDPQPAPAPEANISIRRANGDAAETDPLTTARRMLARGQLQRAQSRLRELTEAQPGLTEAHELLAGTLMRRGRHDAAARVLESGLGQARNPAPLAALLGRLLLERGEITRARNVLKTHAPGLADNPEYHLLLAAAQRQAGDHAAAAEHYRELTAVLPRSGAAWIGLGASLESLEQPADAVSAYQRALDGDDERAARFARKRLRALEPVSGEPAGEASGENPGERPGESQ